MQSEEEKWGIFWCGLLHGIIFDDLAGQSAHQYMENLSTKEVLMPDGQLRKPSLSTLKRKLKEYREGGLSALARKVRSDRGKVRAVEEEILAKAIELKREQPMRSDKAINLMLRSEYGKSLSKTTLYRHLREAGATRKKLGISQQPVRKRWSRDHTHSLWVGDFEDGPCVLLDNGAVKVSHLCLFIDCYSLEEVLALVSNEVRDRGAVRGGRQVLSRRGLVDPDRFTVESLEYAWRERRPLPRQRQDLSCQWPESGLL